MFTRFCPSYTVNPEEPGDEPAAVQPHHHGRLRPSFTDGGEDVQHQAVFALRLAAVEDEPLGHARVGELRRAQADGVDSRARPSTAAASVAA
jgi:hypothetical protein